MQKINKWQIDLKNPKEKTENENITDNMRLIEKIGKLKNMSNEEIKREQKKVQLIEEMSTFGTIMKNKIIQEKETNPENFFSKEEIIQQKGENEQIYILGIFSQILENQGMTVAIEKKN